MKKTFVYTVFAVFLLAFFACEQGADPRDNPAPEEEWDDQLQGIQPRDAVRQGLVAVAVNK
jgi:hypothetical protein